jgi:hypothetical protein
MTVNSQAYGRIASRLGPNNLCYIPGETMSEQGYTQQRKARSDKGKTQITARDLSVLTWIGEQYAARLDQVQGLLGRDAARETQEAGLVAPGTAKRVLNRWLKLGMIETQKILHATPAWIWLSREGLRQLGMRYRYYAPTPSNLEHLYWVNEVRLYCEQKRGGNFIWRSERELRRQGRQTHFVDAEIEMVEGQVVGVEIELSRKKLEVLRSIIEQLSREYRTVWYFTRSDTYGLVRSAVAELPTADQPRFQITTLEHVMR